VTAIGTEGPTDIIDGSGNTRSVIFPRSECNPRMQGRFQPRTNNISTVSEKSDGSKDTLNTTMTYYYVKTWIKPELPDGRIWTPFEFRTTNQKVIDEFNKIDTTYNWKELAFGYDNFCTDDFGRPYSTLFRVVDIEYLKEPVKDKILLESDSTTMCSCCFL